MTTLAYTSAYARVRMPVRIPSYTPARTHTHMPVRIPRTHARARARARSHTPVRIRAQRRSFRDEPKQHSSHARRTPVNPHKTAKTQRRHANSLSLKPATVRLRLYTVCESEQRFRPAKRAPVAGHSKHDGRESWRQRMSRMVRRTPCHTTSKQDKNAGDFLTCTSIRRRIKTRAILGGLCPIASLTCLAWLAQSCCSA